MIRPKASIALVASVWLLGLQRHTAHAQRNVTIDDTSKLIVYSGHWTSEHSPLDYGGTHQISIDSGATATFAFTGVGIYYMAPLWPHSVTTVLSVDGGNPVVVNMQDPSVPATKGKDIGHETVQSEAIWGVNGLSNTQHTLIVSMQGDNAEVLMDGLIYTVLDAATTPAPPPPPPAPSPSKTPTTSHSSHATRTSHSASQSASQTTAPQSSSKGVSTAIIATFVVLCLVTIFIVLGFIMYRRRQMRTTKLEIPGPVSGIGAGGARIEMGENGNLNEGGNSMGVFDSDGGRGAGSPQWPGQFVPGPLSPQPPQPNNYYNYNNGIGGNSGDYNHPYVYASAGNAFGSHPNGQVLTQPAPLSPFNPTQALLQNFSEPTSPFAGSNAPLPNPYANWSTTSTVPVALSVSTHDNNRLETDRRSRFSARESVVGLAYLATDEGEDESAPPARTANKPLPLVVMNGGSDDDNHRYGEKSSFDPSRQEGDMIPPFPAPAYSG